MANNEISILVQAKDNATQTLKEVGRAVQQTGESSDEAAPKADRFGSTLGTLASRVRFVAETFAIYKVGQLLTDFVGNAVSASGELEQTNISFQNLIGNAKEASRIFGELTQYANVTPFESKEITSAAKQLLAFGQTGDQVVDTVKKLGDVTSAGGGDLQALALVTGQVFAQGKLRAQDMYQVINDGGAGLIKIMAQNAGGMQKLTAEFDKGGIPAQQYFDAINQATGKGGFAFEGANKQADTFNGRLSTLKDSATQFGEALIGVHTDPQLGLQVSPGGLFDQLKNGIQAVTDNLSQWEPAAQRAIPQFMDKTYKLASQLADYLGPSVSGLWDVIEHQLFPALDKLWHKIIEPLGHALGGAFLLAVKTSLDVLTGILKIISPLINFMADHKGVVETFAGAFALLKTEMMLGAAFDAIKVGIATFQLVTIPSLVASIETVGASWEVQSAKAVASFVVTATKAAVQAVASSAVWVAQAAVASTAWVVTELPKIIASFAVVATKAAIHAVATAAVWSANAAKTATVWVVTQLPKIVASFAWVATKAVFYAADTALAWSINAFRVSLVWTITEMPKLVASFAITAAKATVYAGATSAVWSASAVKTSAVWTVTQLPKIVAGFVATAASATWRAAVTAAAWTASAATAATAWVVTQLPRIVAGFVMTAARAVTQAAITSGAWVAAASTSATVWVVTQLPRIIAAFIATSASAVVNAAVASGAWVASAVTSSQSWEAFQALVATPIVMPAIVVAAAIASLAAVVTAVNSVLDAIKSVNDTATAAAADAKGQTAAEQSVIDSFKAGKISKAEETKILQFMAQPAHHALGTAFAATDSYVAGEHGAELITGGRGSKVYNNRDTQRMLNGGGGSPIINMTNHIYNDMDVRRMARDLGLRLQMGAA